VTNTASKTQERRGRSARSIGARVVGSGLLVAAAAIHLDLYLTGYRTIPTIGWLFLLQVVTGFVLGAAVLVTGSALAALSGALFAVSTLGGYVLSLLVGLFGFKEVRTTAGIVAGVIEVVAFATLSTFAWMRWRAGVDPLVPPSGLLRALNRWAIPLVASGSAAAAGVLGGSLAAVGGGAPIVATGGRTVLRTAEIGGKKVLTNAKGFTLYWFAIDSPGSSRCNGSCAAYWPPLIGSPPASTGIAGKFSAISRSDGQKQVAYNGHPLYTYIGDSAPGQNHGNGINLNGGLWHEAVVSR
jgi:predicted lipoprotein with Yx(FWY)xxD motif